MRHAYSPRIYVIIEKNSTGARDCREGRGKRWEGRKVEGCAKFSAYAKACRMTRVEDVFVKFAAQSIDLTLDDKHNLKTD